MGQAWGTSPELQMDQKFYSTFNTGLGRLTTVEKMHVSQESKWLSNMYLFHCPVPDILGFVTPIDYVKCWRIVSKPYNSI